MKKIVLFDFDGVLVDSYDYSYRISKELSPKLTEDIFRELFEGNIYDGFEKFDGEEIDPSDDPFYKAATPILMQTAPIAGVPEMLKTVNQNHTLIVLSSTISNPIGEYLKKYNLAHYFDAIMGGDVHKSKERKIHMIFEKYVADPADCIFVTDTLGDMKEAAKCSVKSIGVTWGFHEKERMEKGEFFAFVDSVQQIPEAVNTYFANV